jgi:hypothetical protein
METKKPLPFDGAVSPKLPHQTDPKSSVALVDATNSNPVDQGPVTLKPVDPTQPDREIPDKLLRAMRRAVPTEYWPSSECQLRRGYNMRLRVSEEMARAYVERETKAFNEASWKQLWGNIGRAAAATVAAAAYFLTKYLGR